MSHSKQNLHFHHGELTGDYEDPVASSAWLWVVLFSAALVITILGVTAITYRVAGEEDARKVVDAHLVEVETLREEQSRRIESEPFILDYVNELQEREQALVIPIDRAMDLVAREYGPGGGSP